MNPRRTQTYHPKQPTSPGSHFTHAIPSSHTRLRRAIQGEPEASAFFPSGANPWGASLVGTQKGARTREEGREARSNCYCFSLCVWLCLAFPQSHLLFWFPFSFSSPTLGKTSSHTSLGCWRDELRRSTSSTYTRAWHPWSTHMLALLHKASSK